VQACIGAPICVVGALASLKLSKQLGRARPASQLLLVPCAFVTPAGSSGRCSVHAGVECATGQPVAIKILPRSPTNSTTSVLPEEARSVAFEVAALAACAHPHVVGLRAISHVGMETYIALERCEGDLVRFLTAPRQAPEAVITRMMRQVRRGSSACARAFR
jgi:hypothetical protein